MERDFFDEKEQQRRTERMILLIYNVYIIFMILTAVKAKWGNGVEFFMFSQILTCWILFAVEFKTYRFRAMFTAVAMQLGFCQYAANQTDLFPVLAVQITMVVLLGMYGVKEVIYTTLLTVLFLFFYHGVILGTIQADSFVEACQILFWMICAFSGQYLIYLLIHRCQQSRQEFLQIIQVLKETEHSKDDFLANVSHEIRTPINTICGMSKVALRENDVHVIKEDVRAIRTAGRSLMSVVSDILDFSELRSGKVEIEEEAYNITSTINDVITMSMAKKAEKSIELIVDCDSSLPCCLLGDEKKIRRVIMNLVNNAIKFTNEGCVSITIEGRQEEYGINLVITIRDTGIGMTEESLEKLFTSFNQVDTRRNRQEGGIGLGLAISQMIVRKMGGAITVKSHYGKGSMLRVAIPQKVIDDRPIAQLEHRKDLNVAVYIDMEQFRMTEIRDEYSGNIKHMAEQMKADCCICRNLSELKRREESDHFTHIFISFLEYQEDQVYFDELSRKTNLVVILDRKDDKKVVNSSVMLIYKPFYILPIVSVLNGQGENEREKHMVHAGRFTAPQANIMVVDDNLMNIKVIEGMLRDYKIGVTMALNGAEALDKVELMNYDFIFMDHMMPDMDGVETLHRIRKKPGAYYQKVPVIALTANAVAGTREMFLQEGFTDFLEKPIEASVLERVLRRNLPESKIIYEKKKETEPEMFPTKEKQEEFAIGDLDVHTGMMYCGGREKYIQILRMHRENGMDSKKQLEHLFEKQDWKNYTIAVHGIKSFMLSIGATVLSGMAKRLEMAGKEEDIAYILKNHEAMLTEYQRVEKMLEDYLQPGTEKDKQTLQPGTEKDNQTLQPEQETILPELTKEQADQSLLDFENAMYDLDGEQMMEQLEYWNQFQYHGSLLREVLAPVRRKVEMSDYMSAVQTVKDLFDKLEDSGKAGEEAC